MTGYCLDASALVKRYAEESGSAWVLHITDTPAQHTILLAEITLAEVGAAIAAKQRAPGGLTLEERNRALSRFLQDCDEHSLLAPVDRGVIDRAVELTQRYRLRGYDALQLATALVASDELTAQALPPLVFVANDDDLLTAANAEGLSAENPMDHADLDALPPAP